MLEQGEPRCSGRVVRQPYCFIGLGMVPKEPETSPCNYNEAIQDNDVTLWQKDNEYWSLVSSLYGVKLVG